MQFTVDSFTKEASDPSARKELAQLMEKIRSESPWKWPHGLNIEGHDDIYMVRSASDNSPVGFVGWQERKEGHTKIGYYTIGILPEYRGNGYAKEAVSKIMQIKSASVDKVKALIVKGNVESEALAKSLEVDYILKSANLFTIDKLKALGVAGMKGLGTAGMHDVVGSAARAKFAEGDDYSNFASEYTDPEKRSNITRAVVGLLNFGLGTRAKSFHEASLKPVGVDLMLYSPSMMGKLSDSIRSVGDKIPTPKTVQPTLTPGQKAALLTAAGIGAAGLGVAGIASLRKQKDNKDKGRIRVTLPTKDPGDHETTVELPMDDNLQLSNNIYRQIGTDTRKRLRGEVAERKKIRDEVRKAEATKAAKKYNMLASELDKLHTVKAAGTLPVYDPSLRGGNTQPQPGMVPPGTPASMAYSPLYNGGTAPATSGAAPAGADGGNDETLDKLEKTEKELDTLRKENIELKVETKAREIAEKMSKNTPAQSTSQPETPAVSPGMEQVRDKLADLRTTLQGLGKSAAVQPPTVPPVTQKRDITPRQMNTLFYDISNRKLPNGRGGIQAPVTLHNAAFGRGTHETGTFLRRTLMPVRPTARGTFTEQDPQQIGWPQRIMNMVGTFAQQQAGQGAPPSPFSY